MSKSNIKIATKKRLSLDINKEEESYYPRKIKTTKRNKSKSYSSK